MYNGHITLGYNIISQIMWPLSIFFLALSVAGETFYSIKFLAMMYLDMSIFIDF